MENNLWNNTAVEDRLRINGLENNTATEDRLFSEFGLSI